MLKNQRVLRRGDWWDPEYFIRISLLRHNQSTVRLVDRHWTSRQEICSFSTTWIYTALAKCLHQDVATSPLIQVLNQSRNPLPQCGLASVCPQGGQTVAEGRHVISQDLVRQVLWLPLWIMHSRQIQLSCLKTLASHGENHRQRTEVSSQRSVCEGCLRPQKWSIDHCKPS